MKIKNYDEIKCLVLDLVDSLYPNHECIVLTGSTLEPLYHRPQSDIDVVVVSKEFTGITSHVLRHRQKVIDITRVGYFQLSDLLIENCYNPTAILLTMLSTGKILRDRNDLGKTLITYTRELSTMGNLSYRSDAYSLTRSLVKLRKHLGKRLDRTFDRHLVLHGMYDILIEETIAATSIDIIEDRYRHCRMPDAVLVRYMSVESRVGQERSMCARMSEQ